MNLEVPQYQPTVRKNAAFSFVEVLMGMGVVGVLVVSLTVGISSGFATVQLARENLRATQIMLEKMETIRLYTWDQINTAGFIPETFEAPYYPVEVTNQPPGLIYQGRLSVGMCPSNVPYTNDMRKVTVQVAWTSGSVSRTRSMTSLVSKNGLQPYIY